MKIVLSRVGFSDDFIYSNHHSFGNLEASPRDSADAIESSADWSRLDHDHVHYGACY